jgi:hypothetical protein
MDDCDALHGDETGRDNINGHLASRHQDRLYDWQLSSRRAVEADLCSWRASKDLHLPDVIAHVIERFDKGCAVFVGPEIPLGVESFVEMLVCLGPTPERLFGQPNLRQCSWARRELEGLLKALEGGHIVAASA